MTKFEIFAQAQECRTDTERVAFLEHACGEDAELRADVESLLANDADDDFLQHPPPGAEDDQVIGSTIGPYKILEQVGEGGMGIVYMAEQRQPIVRRVALKVIKAGMDTKQVIARFEVERQALALMDHPNIARILDAGSTERNVRPWR